MFRDSPLVQFPFLPRVRAEKIVGLPSFFRSEEERDRTPDGCIPGCGLRFVKVCGVGRREKGVVNQVKGREEVESVQRSGEGKG